MVLVEAAVLNVNWFLSQATRPKASIAINKILFIEGPLRVKILPVAFSVYILSENRISIVAEPKFLAKAKTSRWPNDGLITIRRSSL